MHPEHPLTDITRMNAQHPAALEALTQRLRRLGREIGVCGATLELLLHGVPVNVKIGALDGASPPDRVNWIAVEDQRRKALLRAIDCLYAGLQGSDEDLLEAFADLEAAEDDHECKGAVIAAHHYETREGNRFAAYLAIAFLCADLEAAERLHPPRGHLAVLDHVRGELAEYEGSS